MPISAEDPYASMEKDQLISMIHFLVKREDEYLSLKNDNDELLKLLTSIIKSTREKTK